MLLNKFSDENWDRKRHPTAKPYLFAALFVFPARSARCNDTKPNGPLSNVLVWCIHWLNNRAGPFGVGRWLKKNPQNPMSSLSILESWRERRRRNGAASGTVRGIGERRSREPAAQTRSGGGLWSAERASSRPLLQIGQVTNCFVCALVFYTGQVHHASVRCKVRYIYWK